MNWNQLHKGGKMKFKKKIITLEHYCMGDETICSFLDSIKYLFKEHDVRVVKVEMVDENGETT